MISSELKPMKWIRSTNARTLNGGVKSAARASAKKMPNRPSASTTAIAQPPTASKGRSAGASDRSGMRSAINSQRPEREILGVQVVLQVEDPREARAVPERVFPRPVLALRAQEVVDAALHGRATRAAGGEQPQ